MINGEMKYVMRQGGLGMVKMMNMANGLERLSDLLGCMRSRIVHKRSSSIDSYCIR